MGAADAEPAGIEGAGFAIIEDRQPSFLLDGVLLVTGAIFERIIPQTVAALVAENPTVVVPAHCAGWKAQLALAAGLPDAFVPNSVDGRFEL